MTFKTVCRAERAGEQTAICELVARAYADIPYSDRREHLMVERLRESDAFCPELSLVAEMEHELVGHILLTRAMIVGERARVPALALAPLSVLPETRRLGIGAQLVRTAHRRAAELGHRIIVLVGVPDYYPRFGYQRLSEYPIVLPFQVPDAGAMILPLVSQALEGVEGRVRYADAWLNH